MAPATGPAPADGGLYPAVVTFATTQATYKNYLPSLNVAYSLSELCRREQMASSQYSVWPKDSPGRTPKSVRHRRALPFSDKNARQSQYLEHVSDPIRSKRALKAGKKRLTGGHGHCALWLYGSDALVREPDPTGQAVRRVFKILNAHKEAKADCACAPSLVRRNIVDACPSPTLFSQSKVP